MRNTIGHYIDSLGDEQRDRVLMAQDWCSDRAVYMNQRCLVAHAEGCSSRPVAFSMCGERSLAHVLGRRFSPATRFDALVARVGMTKAVALCKQRAGAKVRVEAPRVLVPRRGAEIEGMFTPKGTS